MSTPASAPPPAAPVTPPTSSTVENGTPAVTPVAAPPRARRTIPVAGRIPRPGGRSNRRTDAPPPQSNTRVAEHGNLRWVDIRKPGSRDVAALGEEFGFHPLSLEDVVSRMQRPKVDVYDDYLFVVMHFPVHNKTTRTTHAAEIDFFIGPNYVITAHDGSLKPLARMFDNVMDSTESRARIMSQTTAHLLYYIVDRLVDYVFPIIDRLTDRVEEIEDDIFASASPSVVQEISIVRRDLIALRRVVKPQSSIVSQLERRQWPLAGDDIDEYFGDIADHLGKIWDSLEDLKEVVEGLSATYDSLATHRLNSVIKTLTVISVIILPLTLLTGIFGMNVPLPFGHTDWALGVVLGAMLAMTVAMLAVFRQRKWI